MLEAIRSLVVPPMSYITAMARPYSLEPFIACLSTVSKWSLCFASWISPTKRCMNTPSSPYCFIHLKCVSTVDSS